MQEKNMKPNNTPTTRIYRRCSPPPLAVVASALVLLAHMSHAQSTPTSQAVGEVTGSIGRLQVQLNAEKLVGTIDNPFKIEHAFNLPTSSVSLITGNNGQIIWGHTTSEIKDGHFRLRLRRAAGDSSASREFSFLVTANTKVEFTLVEGSNLQGEATASIGGADARSSMSVASGYNYAQDSQSKRKLISKKVDFNENGIGIGEIEIPFSISIKAGTPNYADLSFVSVGATATLAQDTRSVSLSRASAAYEWQTNDNGVVVKHSDTIYSFTEHQSLQAPEYVPVKQTFQSSLGGGWSTKLLAPDSDGYDITWNWTTPGGLEEYSNTLPTATNRQQDAKSETRYNTMSRVTEKGDLEAWYGFLGNTTPEYTGTPKSAKTAEVKYFARDNIDQAEAEARYSLTIHEPIEIVDEKSVARSSPRTPLYDSNGNLVIIAGINPNDTPVPEGTYSYSKTGTVGNSTGASGGGAGSGIDFRRIKKLLKGKGGVTGGIDAGGTWENYVETSGQRGIVYQLPLYKGQGLYVTYVVNYNDHSADYRWFTEAGEIKSPGSPMPQPGVFEAPKPSIPWNHTWQTNAGNAALDWELVDSEAGDEWPQPNGTNTITLPKPSVNQS